MPVISRMCCQARAALASTYCTCRRCLLFPLQYGGFTLPLAYGRGILGLKWGPLPERHPLTTVIGAPIALPPFEGAEGRC